MVETEWTKAEAALKRFYHDEHGYHGKVDPEKVEADYNQIADALEAGEQASARVEELERELAGARARYGEAEEILLGVLRGKSGTGAETTPIDACFWCGRPFRTTPEMVEHVQECAKNPLVERIAALERELTEAREHLGIEARDLRIERDATAAQVAALEQQLAEARADVVAAAGDLPIPIPEPGTDMARLLIANRLLKSQLSERTRERDEARRLWSAEVKAREDTEYQLRDLEGEEICLRCGKEPVSVRHVSGETWLGKCASGHEWRVSLALVIRAAEQRASAAEAQAKRYREALERARSLLDDHMGDTDPADPDDPELLAMQTICAALAASPSPETPATPDLAVRCSAHDGPHALRLDCSGAHPTMSPATPDQPAAPCGSCRHLEQVTDACSVGCDGMLPCNRFEPAELRPLSLDASIARPRPLPPPPPAQLRSLPGAELAQVQPLSPERIQAALNRGARDRAAAENLTQPPPPPAPQEEHALPEAPKTAEEVKTLCRTRHQQWCHLCEDFGCVDNTAPRCAIHPKAPTRRFGGRWLCSECGYDAHLLPNASPPPPAGDGERLRLDARVSYTLDDRGTIAIDAPGFTTIRVCIDCGVLIAGGPTRCVACVRQMKSAPPQSAPEED